MTLLVDYALELLGAMGLGASIGAIVYAVLRAVEWLAVRPGGGI